MARFVHSLVASMLAVACNGRSRGTVHDDAPAARSAGLAELMTAAYDFRRVRYYPEEVGQIRQCDVAEPPRKRSNSWIVGCYHPHGEARIELSAEAPIELGEQLAIQIDGVVDDLDVADIRGHLIERRGRHPVMIDPHGSKGGCCDSRATESPDAKAARLRAPGFDFERIRREPALVGTHHSCVVVASGSLAAIDQAAINPSHGVPPELRWKAAVTCGHPAGQSRITILFRSADVALSVLPDTIIDVRVINGPAAIVDEGNWVMVPPRSPPWQR